jgi:Tol biopolymer transport system component
MRSRTHPLRLVATLFAAAQAACAGDPGGPSTETGTIRVVVETAGAASDPNGYTVIVDDTWLRSIDPIATLTRQVSSGAHVVRLDGIASNCSLEGSNPRPVAVGQNEVVEVRFTLQCAQPTGGIAVRVVTDHPDRIPAGHTVVLDRRDSVHVAAADSIEFAGLPDGVYTIELVNANPYCFAGAGGPRNVTVTGTVVLVDLSVTCRTPPRGELLFDLAGNVWKTDLSASNPSRMAAGHRGRWSPDGQRIAFSSGDAGASRVYVMSPGDAAPQAVAEGGEPDWSPDGTRLVYVQQGQLYTANLDGSDVRPLGVAAASAPAWSPDGRSIAFTHTDSCRNEPIFGRVCTTNINLIDADGTHLRVATTAGGVSASWSPDGRRIAYVRPGVFLLRGPRIILLDVQTGSEQAFALGVPSVSCPVWSPDGAYVVFNASFSDGFTGIVLAGTDPGSALVRLGYPNACPTSWH